MKIFRYIFLLLLLVFLLPTVSKAQFNIHELSKKQVYFGIALGVNMSDFKVIRKQFDAQSDTVKSLSPKLGPGFNLGIIANYQFHKNFDLRLIPTLSFAEKNIEYETKVKQQSVVKQSISSIYLSFPLLLRFKSDPIKDFRLYVIAGMRYDFDLASNSNTRAKTLIKVNKHDISAEYGVGFMIYFPYFILSPEFKMSHGILNVNSPTDGYMYSRVIDKMYSRTFTFTINLEG